MTLRVSVLGAGAIGGRVAAALARGGVPGAELVGVVTRAPKPSGRFTELDIDTAIGSSDIVVEAAGIDAVRQHGPGVIASGTDLLITSVGALADDRLRHALLHGGPGRTRLTAGAIGGLDILAAASLDDGLDAVSLTSTKRPTSLIQPWMDAATVNLLRTTSGAVTLFDGGVREAVRLFPKSLNVAVAVAVATGLWDATTVTLAGDPGAPLTIHDIRASGSAGDYRFSITNRPLADNPASSGVVSAAILRGLAGLASPSGTFL